MICYILIETFRFVRVLSWSAKVALDGEPYLDGQHLVGQHYGWSARLSGSGDEIRGQADGDHKQTYGNWTLMVKIRKASDAVTEVSMSYVKSM